MTAKHTQEPWWTTSSGIRSESGYIAHTNSVQHYEGQDERYVYEVAQREADKCLIAAAPELLKTLKLCKGNISSLPASAHQKVYGEWLAVVSTAIAKATGVA